MSVKKRSETAVRYEFNSYRDITPMHVSTGNMLFNKTGSWRFIKPMYEDKTPACQNACPAGNDIEGWLKLLGKRELKKAYWHLKREEPFPAILGRVCFKFCEAACNRSGLDSAIGIRELELFIGDQALSGPPQPDMSPDNGKRLAVIGSGPAGMSAAYFARYLGFAVTMFDKEALPGGILRLGIPAYRLPREVVAAEFEGLVRMGVVMKLHTEIGRDVSLEDIAAAFDYVFLATGAHRSLALDAAENSDRIMSGLSLLRRVAVGDAPELGRNVVVVGGGNTAIDAARTAVRLGARVTVLYRRTESEMPAHPEDVREAAEEGVAFRFLAAPERICLLSDDTIEKLVCCEMTPGPPDETGRCAPVRKEGATFDVQADTLVTAIGESPELEYLKAWMPDATNGRIGIQPDLSLPCQIPGKARIFAGGDMGQAPRTVVHAVASGKRAAIAMDCDRKGVDPADVFRQIQVGNGGALSFSRYMDWSPVNPVVRDDKSVVDARNIVYDYFEKTPGIRKQLQSGELRKTGFTPYQTTLTPNEALKEAERCMHCGRCTECDNCLIFCPDVSILDMTRDAFGYAFDYDYCKGCGICFRECPRHAITMVEE